jgi:outer membrane receptor protein involved in Fe transport
MPVRPAAVLACTTFCCWLLHATAAAQGPTSAALEGRVLRAESDSGLEATVVVTDTRTAQRLERQTGPGGRFRFDGLTPGGPYTVAALLPGYRPAEARDLMLALGQRLRLQLTLVPQAVTLDSMTVTARRDAGPGRGTGPSFVVSDTAVRRLPLTNRDFVGLIQTAPEVNGTSIASGNNRYNNLQIDGAADNDFFGLSRGTGAPGGQIGVRSLPMEAVREIQVLVAPFDVQQGDFLAGRVNVVTQSGTNRFHGALFNYYQGSGLTGEDSTGARASNFSDWQFGGAGGGPIIRDRLHFFVAGELRRRNAPFTGALIAPGSGAGISPDSVQRFVSILQGYGLEAGSFGPYTTHDESGNLFAKLSAVLGRSGVLEGSLNYADGDITDTLAPPRTVGGDYRLTSAGFVPNSSQWSGRLRWSTLLGRRLSNELAAGYLHVSEPRTPVSTYPGVFVSNVGDPGFGGARLVAGADPSSQQLSLIQRAIELSNTTTLDLGPHVVTAGVHAELLHFDFASLPSAIGQYQFASLASLEAGTPSRFIRGIALRPGGADATFDARSLGFFLQDHWEPLSGLTLTAGLRVDLPTFNDTPQGNAVLLASPLAVNTADFIGTTPLWSPRLGVRWLLRPGTTLRGGAGLFAGPAPYSWASFAYTQTGNDAVTLTCSGAAAPAFVPDASAQPSACKIPGTFAAPTVTYFAPDFKLPQVLKLAVGVDQTLPGGFVASLDGLYQRGSNSLYISDVNLSGPVGVLPGEGNRVLYGTIAPTSAKGALPTVTPARVTTAFGPVLQISNRGGDRTYLLTAQIRRRFHDWLELNAAYTYTDAQDLISLRDAQTVSNYGFVPVVGTLADRSLATSVFSTPNKLTLSGTVNLPLDAAFTVVYIGSSGIPYTYVVNGDANGDAVGNLTGAFDRQANDPVYVPRDDADINLVRDSTTPGGNVLVPDPAGLARLDAFIQEQSCLQGARGTILARNACRNPWQSVLNARLAKRITLAGQSLEISLDAFNVLHLINGDWGLIRQTGTLTGAGTENVALLKLRGEDVADGRNLYELTLPVRDAINVEASRWRLQLGARYAF